MTKATLEEMRDEAVRRLKILGAEQWQIKLLEEKNQYTWHSEQKIPQHELLRFQTELSDLQKKFHFFGYLVIRSKIMNFNLDSILMVSEEKDDWEIERENLKNGIAFAYVVNNDEPVFSEFGSITVTKNPNGSFIRRG